MSMW